MQSSPATAGEPAVRCRSLGIDFGSVRALRDVSIDLAPGRIHALVGQNGAGKTTLAKVLGGFQAPHTGEVFIAGERLPPGDVRAARAAGLAIVHQHFSLPPSFTVAEALELTAARPAGRPVYRRAELHRRWQSEVAEIGGEAVLSRRVRDLPVETRQMLEIVRALSGEARILMLDEPTALLTPAASDALFQRLRRLRDEGVTVIVVLHKLREVAAVADTVSVLRDGELVLGPSEAAEVSQGRLSDAIVGPDSPDRQSATTKHPKPDTTDTATPDTRPDTDTPTTKHHGAGGAHQRLLPPRPDTDTPTTNHHPQTPADTATPAPGACRVLLDLVGVSSRESAFEPGLRGIDLSVGTGEIVGIAGVEGNGQRSLVSVVAGLTAVSEGSVLLGGVQATRAPAARRRLRGLRIVPFDRNSEGISRRAPLWLNQSALRLLPRQRRRLPRQRRREPLNSAPTQARGPSGATRTPPVSRPLKPSLTGSRPRGQFGGARLSPSRMPLVSLRQYKRQAAEALDRWQVRYESVTQSAESLSGGNVQRLILSRELAPGLDVLVAAQPTRGLDFSATGFVRRSLQGLRDGGAGILLVSSDLDELFELSDRLAVMCGGSIVATFDPPYDRRSVGDAMTGARR